MNDFINMITTIFEVKDKADIWMSLNILTLLVAAICILIFILNFLKKILIGISNAGKKNKASVASVGYLAFILLFAAGFLFLSFICGQQAAEEAGEKTKRPLDYGIHMIEEKYEAYQEESSYIEERSGSEEDVFISETDT